MTTDLAGFGQWALTECEDSIESSGVKVIHRSDSNYSDVVCQIADNLYGFFAQAPTSREAARNAAMATSKKASWQNFIARYIEAYEQAVANMRKCGR